MANERRQVIHILRAPVGGLFRHVRDLAMAQAAAGHHVGVIADASTGDRLTDGRLAALSPHLRLGLHRVPMARTIGLRDMSATVAIGRVLSDQGAAVVHGHGAKGGAYARMAARLLPAAQRPRVVYTPHGGSLHYAPGSSAGRLYMLLEQRLLPWTDGIVFESRYSARLFAERVSLGGVATAIVPNGLAEHEFEDVEPNIGATHFLFVGELRRLKGVDCLLDAIAALHRGGRHATLTCVGDGPDAAHFRAKATELGLGPAVSFPGAMPARAAFQLGCVLIVPSLAESFPYIVLEGAAAGRPLIATDVGGIPEIVAGADQRLLPPGDVAALAAAMAAAFDDLAHGRGALQVGARRLKRAVHRQFTIAGMATSIEHVYGAAAVVPSVASPSAAAHR